MKDITDPLEIFWDNMLSRVPDRVRAAFAMLQVEERQAVLEHLRTMASEPGWHPEQRRSAEAALEVLEN